MQDYEAILAEQPFSMGLDRSYLRLIAGCASEICFAAEEYIFHQGEEANWFYLIRQGKVALEVHTPERGVVTLQTVGEGEILGTSWLFPPYLWQYDARAIKVTRAIAFNALCLRGACEEDHDLGYELMKRFAQIMIQRLHATRLQLLDAYSDPVRG